MFCNKLSINNNDIYGKPYWDGVLAAYFNISHTSQYEMGVDVEVTKNIDIVKKYITKEEYQYIITQDSYE